MGLVAQPVASASASASGLTRLVATGLLFFHIAMDRRSSDQVALPLLRHAQRHGDTLIPATPDVRDKTVVLMNPPNDLFYVYVPRPAR